MSSSTVTNLLLLGSGSDPLSERGVTCAGEIPAASDPDLVARAKAARAAIEASIETARLLELESRSPVTRLETLAMAASSVNSTGGYGLLSYTDALMRAATPPGANPQAYTPFEKALLRHNLEFVAQRLVKQKSTGPLNQFIVDKMTSLES